LILNLAKQETDIYLSLIKRQAAAGDEYREVRNFIEMRQPHQGPVHILLVTGVVGGVFFVLFCVSLLLYSFRSVIKTQPKQITPIQIWAVAMLVPEIFGFFVVFGDLTNFLIRVCPVALLLYRFERLKALAPVSPEPLAEMNSSVSAPELAWPPNPSWQPRQPPVS